MAILCTGLLLSACTGTEESSASAAGADASAAAAQTADSARVIEVRLPEASGTTVFTDNGITVDASNTAEGYVMARAEQNEKRLKLRISHDAGDYTYDLPSGTDYVAFPLQMGDGKYTVRAFENAYDNMYEPIFEERFSVTLDSEFAPFLMPSQYVNYDADSAAVAESFALVSVDMSASKAVKTLYRYVVKNLSYDNEKAATVGRGYLPDPDETLASGKGICFDYSALLATMLRAQGIPTQLVIGTVSPDNLYHAWNLAYVDDEWLFLDSTLDGSGRKEQDYGGERFY